MISTLKLCLIAPIIVMVASTGTAQAGEKRVRLGASERVPFIGKDLPDNGYVAELAREAFRRQGYQVVIEFYPPARLRRLTEAGVLHGAMPVYRDPQRSDTGKLLYSGPIPGDTTGLLKRKSLPFTYSRPSSPQGDDTLASVFQGYRIGMVRDGATLPELDRSHAIIKDMAVDDLMNIDKLDHGRIDFALIDKYTAADLIARQRPHLIGQIEFVSSLPSREFHIGFSRQAVGYQKLADAFNEGLQELKRDGTLARIQEKHGLLPAPRAASNKTVLNIGTVNNSDMAVLRQLSQEFEARYPRIQLEWRLLDEDTLRQRLLSDMIVADGQFDVISIGNTEVPVWAQRGWITPLNLHTSYEVDDLVPAVRNSLTAHGQLFAAPFYAESSMTYYRKDLFAEAGISMPSQPSYDDIKRFAARIHNPGQGIYGICLRGKPGWGDNVGYVSTLVNSFGGRWFSETWRPELDTPEWEKAVNLYKDLLLHYGPPHAERNGFNENLALFSAGRCGIWIDATVAAGSLFDPQRSKVASQVGHAPAPVAVTAKGSAWLWVWALAVPNSSSRKKEAMEFIAWATSKDYIQNVSRKNGWVGVPPGTRLSTYASQSYLKAAPFASFVLSAIQNTELGEDSSTSRIYQGKQNMGIPEFPAIGTILGQELAMVLRQERSVRDALSLSQRRVMNIMKKSGYIAPHPVAGMEAVSHQETAGSR